MEYIRLGKTNLLVSRVAFGAMRLKEGGTDETALVVRKAYDAGVNFFDTSRKKEGSEKLLGDALFDIRKNVFLSTTTSALSPSDIRDELEQSLLTLHTDFLDLYQFETEHFVPVPGYKDKVYETLVELKEEGKIRHIGICTQDYDTAVKAVESGLFETLQFPFSVLSPLEYADLVKKCEESDMGFIAMQPLGGGLLANIPIAFGFLNQYENVIPLWGATNDDELSQILYFNEHPPVIDEQFKNDVDNLRNFFN